MNKGILLGAYAVFTLVGLATIGVGGYYASQVPGSSSSVAVAVASIGGAMLFVGGVACFALWKEVWPLLTIVFFCDLALFIALIMSCILGVILGMDVRDPTRAAVDRAFLVPAFLSSHWDTGYCQELATYTDSDKCSMTVDSGFGKVAAAKIEASADWDAAKYSTRDIFGNCSVAFTGSLCLPVGNSTECVAQLEPDDAFGNQCLDCQHACR